MTGTPAVPQAATKRRFEASTSSSLSPRIVARHCERIGIEFFSTPFSPQAVDLLTGLGVRRIKLPSGEITNRPLLQKAAGTGLPLLLSTGMSTLDEVRTAVNTTVMATEQGSKAVDAGARQVGDVAS